MIPQLLEALGKGVYNTLAHLNPSFESSSEVYLFSQPGAKVMRELEGVTLLNWQTGTPFICSSLHVDCVPGRTRTGAGFNEVKNIEVEIPGIPASVSVNSYTFGESLRVYTDRLVLILINDCMSQENLVNWLATTLLAPSRVLFEKSLCERLENTRQKAIDSVISHLESLERVSPVYLKGIRYTVRYTTEGWSFVNNNGQNINPLLAWKAGLLKELCQVANKRPRNR